MEKHWCCDFCFSSRSLAVGHQYSSLGTQPILCGSIPGLVPKQLRFCRNYVEIMPSVAEGVKIGIQECQHQFRGRRWNCTTVTDNLAIFGPVLDKGKGVSPASSDTYKPVFPAIFYNVNNLFTSVVTWWCLNPMPPMSLAQRVWMLYRLRISWKEKYISDLSHLNAG